MSSTLAAVTMPQLGLTMKEGKVAAWHVASGDPVETGEEIVDIETEKITNAYESPASGVFRRRVAHEGDTLPVGALIGVIGSAEATEAEIDAFVAEFGKGSS